MITTWCKSARHTSQAVIQYTCNAQCLQGEPVLVKQRWSRKGTVSRDFRPLIFSLFELTCGSLKNRLKYFRIRFRFRRDIRSLIETPRCEWHCRVKYLEVSFHNVSFCYKICSKSTLIVGSPYRVQVGYRKGAVIIVIFKFNDFCT